MVDDFRAAARKAREYGDYQLLKLPGRSPQMRSRKELPSQYLRRRVAEFNGVAEWDWRKVGRKDWSEGAAQYYQLSSFLHRDFAAYAAH